ncbi:MAG TPA: hypothetical protein VEV37_03295 [Bryobacteraceae bacterium]|nr:hypothetical protein [Bryobacteraceae bacterium]
MNGNGENGGNVERRLTRLEEFVEVLTSEHIQFAEEHKRLLTAQVVLTDGMDKLAEAQERTEAHLDVLTRTMDAWIRRNDRQ